MSGPSTKTIDLDRTGILHLEQVEAALDVESKFIARVASEFDH